MSDNSRLQYLLNKYLKDTLTSEEMKEFWSIVPEFEEEKELNKYLEDVWKNCRQNDISYTKADKNKIFAEILHKGRERERKLAGKTFRRMFQLKISAAAALLLLITTAALYFLTQKDGQYPAGDSQTKSFRQDVPPGGNKAVLTLADGSEILLDSAQNGYLAQQEGTKITKLGNGRLAYNAELNEKERVVTNTITTPRGGEYSIDLPDGTKVWLNADSKIIFPNVFKGRERKVEISGEVYFEVAHNAKMPFIVKSTEVEVLVLGTHFNVKAYADENTTKVTLLEGSVRISSSSGLGTTTLHPGEQALLSEGSELKVNVVDVDEVVAWKNGVFQFNETDIMTMMRQIARWYDVEVVYEGKIPSQRFGGMISRQSNLSQVLEILEISGVKFKIEDKKIFIK